MSFEVNQRIISKTFYSPMLFMVTISTNAIHLFSSVVSLPTHKSYSRVRFNLHVKYKSLE